MSDEPITLKVREILRQHRMERWSISNADGFEWWGHCTGCGYEGKRRTRNGPEWELNMRDDEATHVADLVVAALELPGVGR